MRIFTNALLLALAVALCGCRVGYVVKSGWYQAELMRSRVPVEEVQQDPALRPEQAAALQVVADVKAWGRSIGLSATENYETVAWGWKRQIWNLTACEPLAFAPRSWWFPIVGRVTYLGWFRERDAREVQAELVAEGLDVYVRTAGAYSTLGWFRDPILPGMLEWSELDLADTVLHELAHATVWVKGSVDFNESFASFVGEEAAWRYLSQRYGAESPQVLAARRQAEDDQRWRDLQRGLYLELEALYADPSLAPAEKELKKALLFGSVAARVEAAGFHDPSPYRRAAERGVWNNARLIQFRTYNHSRQDFEALLAHHRGDLLSFMRDVQTRTRRGDPYAAIRSASATSPR